MKIFIFILVLLSALQGGMIAPKLSVKTSAPVLDFIVRDGKVVAGTANGEILEIGMNAKVSSLIRLEPLTNYWGEKTPQKIMSVDRSPDGKTLAFAAEDGYLYTARAKKVQKSSFVTRTVVKKIAFVTDSLLMVALLSNEVVFFDLNGNKSIKTLSAGTSPLSDMSLSKDRKIAAIAGEAGIVTLIDTAKMAVTKHLKGGNVDNIYKIDLQNGRIITAGQDRRVIVYTLENRIIARFDGTFLIYSAALSPSGERGAAVMDEENRITVLDIPNRRRVAVASGHTATLNRIVFVDEKRFVSCADENKILFWELP